MKRRFVLVGLLVLIVACLLFWLRWAKEQGQPAVPQPGPAANVPTADSPETQGGNVIRTQAEPSTSTQAPSASSAPPSAGPRADGTDPTLERWRTPIEFYGKVVDENTNPVSGAKISFDCNDTSSTGTSFYHAESDVSGSFSLKGIQGYLLVVKVSKEGYYSVLPFGTNFFYARASANIVPDQENSVIFTLRKKGSGAELITSENGVRPSLWVRVPGNNTPVRVDLFQKQVSPNGQLEISQNKPPWNEATEWSFHMSIPGGGFVENQDEFQFEAPEMNYQQTVEYQFTRSETNWITHATKQFYIVLDQPRRYGWLRIESDLAQETVFLTYAINPAGSRNLEPLEAKPPVPVLPPGMRAVVPGGR
jgi:hypothetical protein